MGKEKDKKPLFGGIFQKFFKPSAKAEAKKKKEHHLTVQRSIPYLEMGRDLPGGGTSVFQNRPLL